MSALADVLVIGGTGLMGAPTARVLQAMGHRVVVMSRGAAKGGGTFGVRPEQASKCEHLVCDRTKASGSSTTGDDPFVNMLGATSCPRTVIDFTAMNKHHIEQVIAAHTKTPLLHYIFISTNMVYPGGPEEMDVSPLSKGGSVLINEDAADLDSDAAFLDTYGGNKLHCEKLLRDAGAATAGASAPLLSTVVRPVTTLSPTPLLSARV